jgi:ribonuclease HI
MNLEMKSEMNPETLPEIHSESRVEIFTDGACRGNPGPGGWGAILRFSDKETRINGASPETTNNRMELQAVISAFEKLTKTCAVHVTTDSRYVMDGVQQWMVNWKRNGWKTAAKKPVKNEDLWKQLDKLVEQHCVTWSWVKGHSGHAENELVDQLANDAIDNLLS